MKLSLQAFIEKIISRAHYEYDDSIRQWAAWIEGFPGVYAQGKSVEGTRQDLVSTLEEHILLSIKEGRRIPGFVFSGKSNAKAA